MATANQREYDRGENESLGDIAAGSPKLYWQTRSSWGELLSTLMADRFNVEVIHTSDMTTSAEMDYENGYNAVTTRHIDLTFGVGSFQCVLDEVEDYRKLHYLRRLGLEGEGSEEA